MTQPRGPFVALYPLRAVLPTHRYDRGRRTSTRTRTILSVSSLVAPHLNTFSKYTSGRCGSRISLAQNKVSMSALPVFSIEWV